MMSFVRSADTLIVHSMDRLARDQNDLHKIVQILTGRGVRIEFIKEHLTFTGDDSPISKLMLSVMGTVHEFERALIKERQLEGIALAKKRGVFKGRKNRPSKNAVFGLNSRTDPWARIFPPEALIFIGFLIQIRRSKKWVMLLGRFGRPSVRNRYQKRKS
jgi:hypothetical protein